MKITFAGLTLAAFALCGLFLVSCVSPRRPVAEYSVPPQGPDEEAVAQAFEALVRAFGSQDWGDVMALVADDAEIESTVADTSPSPGAVSPRVIDKVEFGQTLRPMLDGLRGYHVDDVKLVTMSPTQVQVSGAVTLLMVGKPALHRDRKWTFEKRGEDWLVVRAQDL